MRQTLRLLLLLPLLAPACSSPAPEGGAQPIRSAPVDGASVKPGINEKFLSEELDVDHYVGIFEGESREIAVNREALARSLNLKPGMTVADIGAGTGLFMRSLSERVGSRGKVFGVDISPNFIGHLEARAAADSITNYETVLCTERSVELPPESIDAAFVCDTYHHFEYPFSTLRSIYEALRPGGLLVVVDFDRIPGVSRPWLLDHVRADRATFRAEIEAAGFTYLDTYEISGLAENYVLRFRR